MRTTLSRVGTVVFLLFALYNPQAQAQEVSMVATYELPAETEVAATADSAAAVSFESSPVIQMIPDYSEPWLDGRVSFVGGELSTSERQFAYVEANAIPLIHSNTDYWRMIREGRLVPLRHVAIDVGARRPYVLSATARFIYRIAERFQASGCGRLRINDAARLTSERPRNGSPYSVHPAGMALDLRVINLSERCYQVLSNLLHEAELRKEADVTREYRPPHFHVVVIPEQQPPQFVSLVAEYETDGQSE